MDHSINPTKIATLHKENIIRWKSSQVEISHSGFYLLVEENHAFNYQLWHAEDRARREDMGAEFVYKAKREIDHCNQQRNNRMEAMDEWLFKSLNPDQPDKCPVNSESPGMIIDRLSILSLKSYHMEQQTLREDAPDEHKHNCLKKLHVIHQQLDQLTLCLEHLINEIEAKTRTFRIYHQFKMYNDPSLNPQLYSSDLN